MADILRRALFRSTSMVCSLAAIPKRTLLRTSFGQQEKMREFLERRKLEMAGQTLSSVCLLIDRCTERGMPFSSLTTDSMVHMIEDRDDIISTMYYLHKFRHCDSCYFLRPWTVHTWFGKCLDHGALDLALTALDERSQYGMFPDAMMYILLIDKCLKENDLSLAMKFVAHTFLAECLDSELAQLICLHVVMKTMQNGNAISPDFSSLTEKRNFFALCYRLGQMLNDDNMELLGLAELGAIEKEHGIRTIYQEPWCPLLWEEGYSERALLCMSNSSNIHQEVFDHANELFGNTTTDRYVKEQASSEESFIALLQNQYGVRIDEVENMAVDRFNETIDDWVKSHDQLSKVENEISTEKLQQRQQYFEEKKLGELSKQLAVEKLGYWEFMAEKSGDDDKLDYHLRTDYIEGASSDIEIESKIAADT